MSEWLDIMLEEIARKTKESEEAAAESDRRSNAHKESSPKTGRNSDESRR
jgi:hypothetical protein